MTNALLSASAAALWLGMLSAISPCVLATNIAAVGFISRLSVSMRLVVISGILYSLGRVFAYIILGVLLVTGILSIPGVSFFLQIHGSKVLGFFLVIAGMILLDLIEISLPGIGAGNKKELFEKGGVWSAFPMGTAFALAFCPTSAALFFGSLIPLSLTHNSSVVLPSIFGIGTGIPVVIFSLMIAFGVRSLNKIFQKVTAIEPVIRKLTGWIFVLAGIWMILKFVFRVV